jgi:hypothetical protein
MRRIQGVLQLARQYGNAAWDDACTAALELRVPVTIPNSGAFYNGA